MKLLKCFKAFQLFSSSSKIAAPENMNVWIYNMIESFLHRTACTSQKCRSVRSSFQSRVYVVLSLHFSAFCFIYLEGHFTFFLRNTKNNLHNFLRHSIVWTIHSVSFRSYNEFKRIWEDQLQKDFYILSKLFDSTQNMRWIGCKLKCKHSHITFKTD